MSRLLFLMPCLLHRLQRPNLVLVFEATQIRDVQHDIQHGSAQRIWNPHEAAYAARS